MDTQELSSGDALTGLATGFKDLDRMTSGLQRGDMILIAGKVLMGKTALAMNIAEHIAITDGKAVAVYSLEMSARQLEHRMLFAVARVDIQNIGQGCLNREQIDSIGQASEKISKSRLIIDDTPNLDVLEFTAKVRRLNAEHKLDLIIIDYLQCMCSPSGHGPDRQAEFAQISSGIKSLAKHLDIPIIVLALLYRHPPAKGESCNPRPKLSDLREFGSIEQDADLVGLLWRAVGRAGGEEDQHEADGKAELRIVKNRNGQTGVVPLTCLPIMRFEDRSQDNRTEPSA